MRSLLFLILCISFSCTQESETKESLNYFNREIAARMEVLKPILMAGDSMRSKSLLIDEEVARLILLSKDVENLSACVNRANSFFDALTAEFKLEIRDFTKLNTAMHVNEIELVLKQNELNLFNQIIFKNKGANGLMYTAQ